MKISSYYVYEEAKEGDEHGHRINASSKFVRIQSH